MKTSIKTLIKKVCEHLHVSPRLLRMVEDYAQSQSPLPTEAAQHFSAVCLMLEAGGEASMAVMRTAIFGAIQADELPKYSLDFDGDQRYVALYHTIQQFYRQPMAAMFVCPRAHVPEELQIKVPCDEVSKVGKALAAALPEVFKDHELMPSHKVKHEVEDDPFELPPSAPPLSLKKAPEWDAHQAQAITNVSRWLADKKGPQVYRLFGYAGTGKTTLAVHLAEGLAMKGRPVLYAAFSGKAASVMRLKGCTGADTIHSLIYRPLRDQVTNAVIGQAVNRESPLAGAALLILDEVSMVNEEMALDLLSFGVKILVLGDPKQLKPVKGVGYFMTKPDTLLTEVHRNAKDSPIIYLATRVRNGEILKPGNYGESRVLSASTSIKDAWVNEADTILCGTNRTRQRYNWRARELNGKYKPGDASTTFPVKGDTLICLKNNKDLGLYNGTLWTCTKPEFKTILAPNDRNDKTAGTYDTRLTGLYFRVRSQDFVDANGDLLIVNTSCSMHMFDSSLPKPNWRDVIGCDEWDFGNALTVHKAQGSQWDRTLLIDESDVFSDQRVEHLYTGLTRAAEVATISLTS